MPSLTQLTETLDWIDTLETICIQASGKGHTDFKLLQTLSDDFEFSSHLDNDDDDGSENDDTSQESESPAVDLFSLSETDLEALDFYKVLHLPFKATLDEDDVKKAYRKACLKYHPDKSGRGEDDAVFLKVKAAFDTLSTQKLSYDSTEMPFDESIPDEDSDDFFADFGSCFERNLHFDARLLPTRNRKNNSRRKSRNRTGISKPPSFGDESTPIEKVNEFYDYWAHFESWRDFGLQASRELETQDQLEQAESRYEKRWYQKEIDKRAKKLKQQELSRITTLLERAMAADPRLQKEKQRLLKEKEEKQKRREEEALEKKRQEEEARIAEERRKKEEEENKKKEKQEREKEKKLLRKTKQVFRKHVTEALASLLEPEHALEDEVDIICSTLNREQLTKLNNNLDSKSSAGEVLELVRKRAKSLQQNKQDETEDSPEVVAGPAKEPNESSATTKKKPFTKEEMSTLAKGVKKFPPGGANRWDQIASYINSVCRPEIPRTREECIETFNQNKASTPSRHGPSVAPSADKSASIDASSEDVWSEEQDKALQAALKNFPASLDKNERWTSIAKSVEGKTKKQCVQRFKAIRDALKNRK